MGSWFGAIASLGTCCVAVWYLASRNWLRSWRKSDESPWAEWFLIAVVPLLGAAAYWPFAHNGLLGAGDSYHYTLQIADAVTQARKGHWPILVGQSPYAFNGNVHTVRTAPYLTHLAALIDLVSVHQLRFWQLTNFIVLGSAALAASIVYVCTRWFAPDARALAVFVAVAYVLCPALGTPLMNHDMIATFVATPWLPLVCAAGVQCWRQRTLTAWILLGFGLGMTWLAHPPTAIWITPVAAAAALAAVVANPLRSTLLRALVALALFLLLFGYVVYSVISLNVPGLVDLDTDSSGTILVNIQVAWPDSWKPIDIKSPTLGNIQLGYSLWFCLFAAVFASFVRGRNPKSWFLLISFAVLLACVAPIPLISEWFWKHVPHEVTSITNVWPMQRIYPVLAALAVVALGTAATNLRKVSRIAYVGLVLFLGACVIWSELEFSKLQKHAAEGRQPFQQSVDAYDPTSLVLTRSSYALFDSIPAYYSHGWLNPESESRLLSPTGEISTTDASVILANVSDPADRISITPDVPFTITVTPETDYLFVFNFPSPEIQGEVTLREGRLLRVYTLPRSGEAASFGAGETNQHAFRLMSDKSGTHSFTIHAPPATRVEALRFQRAILPIRVESLTPYLASVSSRNDGFLETPFVYIPGYSARVNGNEVKPSRSPEGMVSIAVPSGKSRVEVSYPGPTGLSILGRLATVAAMAGSFILVKGPRTEEGSFEGLNAPVQLRDYLLFRNSLGLSRVCVAALITAFGIGGAWVATWTSEPADPEGRVRLAVQFPPHPIAASEPLVVTGRKGAADTLYVIYGDKAVQFGLDHWGVGGPISPPIPVTLNHRFTIEYNSPALQFGATASDNAHVRLIVDGKVIFDQQLATHATASHEFFLGRNPVEAGICGPRFTGRLKRLP